jgi:hypothetical protein
VQCKKNFFVLSSFVFFLEVRKFRLHLSFCSVHINLESEPKTESDSGGAFIAILKYQSTYDFSPSTVENTSADFEPKAPDWFQPS